MILYNDITYSFHRTEHGNPGLCPARVLMELIPFDQNPFLHLLRHRCVGVVRRLRRYYGSVRLPVSVHRQRTSLDFLTRPTPVRGGHWLSRFSRSLFLCMHRFSDRVGYGCVSLYRLIHRGLPYPPTVSAPQRRFRGSIAGPAHAFVNASRKALRPTTHDSRSVWLATPLPYDSFIRNKLPV